MRQGVGFDASVPTRQIMREMRLRCTRAGTQSARLPESDLWKMFCVLRGRGEDGANVLLLRGLKTLHDRRATGTSELSLIDPDPHEHKASDDAYLGELWRAYKRCICADRSAPAAQLLRDIEDQLNHHH